MRLLHNERGQEQRVTGRVVPSPTRAPQWDTGSFHCQPQRARQRVRHPENPFRNSRKWFHTCLKSVLVTYSLNPESICEAQSANHYRRGQDMTQNSSKTQLEISPELYRSSWSHEGAWEGVPRKALPQALLFPSGNCTVLILLEDTTIVRYSNPLEFQQDWSI